MAPFSNHYSEYGFEGVGQRTIYGGVQPIPSAFRVQYGISRPYLVGWGGCASRLAADLVTSLGFMALAIPDVTTYPTDVTTIRIFHGTGLVRQRRTLKF